MEEKMTPQSDLLTPEEASQRLGNVKAVTLAKWRSTKKYKLPFIKIGGRVCYKAADVDAFIESRRIVPGEPTPRRKRGAR
jgi:excisionase family DNA binding protein